MTNLLEKFNYSPIPFSETQAKLQVPNSPVYTYIFRLHTPTYYLYFNKKKFKSPTKSKEMNADNKTLNNRLTIHESRLQYSNLDQIFL